PRSRWTSLPRKPPSRCLALIEVAAAAQTPRSVVTPARATLLTRSQYWKRPSRSPGNQSTTRRSASTGAGRMPSSSPTSILLNSFIPAVPAHQRADRSAGRDDRRCPALVARDSTGGLVEKKLLTYPQVTNAPNPDYVAQIDVNTFGLASAPNQ